MYLFNSPVGYSKNPLFYASHDPSQRHKVSEPIEIPKAHIKSAIFQLVAEEILDKIIHHLNQIDSFKLMLTCKKWYQLVKPKLYENIIIDANFSDFNKEFNSYKYQYQHEHSPINSKRLTSTFIKSKYNFKKFLLTYNCERICRFQCICFPESVTILDVETSELLVNFFKTVCGLNELVWLPDNFDLNFLQQLNVQNNNLFTLIANVKMNQDIQILGNFELENLQLSPYIKQSHLLTIVNSFDMSNLQVLKLSKVDIHKDSTVPDPPASKLLQLDSHYEIADLQYLTLQPLHHLRKLSLCGIFINESDFHKLNDSVNLHNIEKLELRSITEYKRSPHHSFLVKLCQHLPNISQLFLDYRESHKDNVPFFLSNIGKLKKLDLVIRNNETKPFKEIEYQKALMCHSEFLYALSLEVKQETALTHRNVPVNLGALDLTNLLNLKCLRINSTNESNNLRLISNLPYLKYLDLFGLKAGGSPNLGLGMVHPTIFDEWFKVQHVALIYLKNNLNLKYVNINDCLFECGHEIVTPREGIDHWFKDMVRVHGIDYD